MKIKRAARLSCVLATIFAAACGARSQLYAPEESIDSGPDAPHDAAHEPDAVEEDAIVDVVFPDVPIVSDCPDAGATFIYVLGAQNQLYSFYPPSLAFTAIGTISCKSTSTPNSMAVTRSGIAFAGFLDGHLFEVSTANAACKGTTYQPNQGGFLTFGMGYAGNADGGETLFVAGNSGTTSKGLGTINTASFTLDFIGQFQPVQTDCELSGTGTGRLFGFCPQASGSNIIEINPANANIISSHLLTAGSNATSFAFAFWGGDFWIFTGNGNSTITQYDPIAQTETPVGSAPIEIVGAGVSTCAPE